MFAGFAGCGARRDVGLSAASPAPSAGVAGLYWGRWAEVPDGMRVAVWVAETGGGAMRGTWDLPPWHGEFSAQPAGGSWAGTWRQEGTVAIQQLRERPLRLRREADGSLRDATDGGEPLVLEHAAAPRSRVVPGLWLGHWTGLPAGVSVETAITATGPSTVHAVYRYQEREGSFDGDVGADGSLAIRWREVSARDGIARGAGRLAPNTLGLRGTYGIEDAESGTGFWSLEALEVP